MWLRDTEKERDEHRQTNRRIETDVGCKQRQRRTGADGGRQPRTKTERDGQKK